MAKRRPSVLNRARSRTVTGMGCSFLVPGTASRPCSIVGPPGLRRGPLLRLGGAPLCDAVAVKPAASSSTAIELAAIDRGAGDDVMLVHGGAIHSGPAWARSIAPLVEAGYRVIAVDRRGHGRSPDGDAAFVSVCLQAEDLAATLSLREVGAA